MQHPNKREGQDLPSSNPNQFSQQLTPMAVSGSEYASLSDLSRRGFTASNPIRRPMFPGVTKSDTNPISVGQTPGMTGVMMQDVENSSEQQQSQVMWGTDINATDLQTKFRIFLNEFAVTDIDEEEKAERVLTGISNYYIRQLNQMKEDEIYVLRLNCDHLATFNKDLYKKLINYPAEIIPYFDSVATELFKELAHLSNIEMNNVYKVQVRPFNQSNGMKMRDLGPKNIDKLVTIKGIVIRCSEVVPEMKIAFFKCEKCNKEVRVLLERGCVEEPNSCSNCKSKKTFQIIHNRCKFGDKQYIKFQETPENVLAGESPMTVHLCAYDDLIDAAKPGDRVDVTGIYKAQPVRVNPRKRAIKSVYRTYIDTVCFKTQDKKRFVIGEEDIRDSNGIINSVDEESLVFSEEKIRQFQELSKDPSLYAKLIDAVAPSIWENTDVKMGILCQLFGGNSKDFAASGRGRFRGEINVLLVGDPSTAKSQILQYVHKIAPRGIYTSGKGSSAVGLTAYVSRDPETKDLILESGGLVLSDKGVCCIDEFDKMSEDAKVILHEAMEQQTVSIAKAGIICTLNARTAVLAAANPVGSRYNPKISVVENIKLPPSLISRFDLIYIMIDKQNDITDRKLANHIVSLFSDNTDVRELHTSNISREFLVQYVTYARKFSNPEIPIEVGEEIVRRYRDLRNAGNSKKTITATPRQLESMIRLAEAHARMRLSKTVELSDLDEAVRLIRVATQQAATDPITGMIDIDLLTTGITSASRQNTGRVVEHIRTVLMEEEVVARRGVKYSDLFQLVLKTYSVSGVGLTNAFTEVEYREALRILEEEDVVKLYGHRKTPNIRYLK